jgi:hypothetical protein
MPMQQAGAVAAQPSAQPWYQMKSGGGQVAGETGTPWYKDPNVYNSLALGFNTMRMNPDQGLAVALQNRIKTAQELKANEASKNKTVAALSQMGMDKGELDLLAENPELLKIAATAMYKRKAGADTTAEMQTFDYLTSGLSEEDKAKALRIKLGIDPRASSELSIPLDRFFNTSFQSGAGTQAAKAQAEINQAAVSNDLLRQQFDFGFNALESALGGTGQTGKIFGNLPAVTTSAQIADNAKALLLPIMKGVFRGAGEGVFTDKDQETLEAMLPTRDMTPEAAAQALDSVKMLVSLKLQNPQFDITTYGRGMSPSKAVNTATATTKANSATPAASKTNVRDAADAILRGD